MTLSMGNQVDLGEFLRFCSCLKRIRDKWFLLAGVTDYGRGEEAGGDRGSKQGAGTKIPARRAWHRWAILHDGRVRQIVGSVRTSTAGKSVLASLPASEK